MSHSVKLPKLFDMQRAIVAGAARFNIVAGGVESGKTVLLRELAITAHLGVSRGAFLVAVIVPTEDDVRIARRFFLSALDKVLVPKQLKRHRLTLITGGAVDFFAADDPQLALLEPYSMVLIDDAHAMPLLESVWEDVALPALKRSRGMGWIFSKPAGARGPLYRLWENTSGDNDWARFKLPTAMNPFTDMDKYAEARDSMDEPLFRQEYGAEFVSDVVEMTREQLLIGPNERFIDWCERLGCEGLKVDGHPFRLDNRPAMRFIYEMIPSTKEEAFQRVDILMKCAQVGFTVMEMLAAIYLAIKFSPCRVGMYLPDMKLAGAKSTERFLPIVRTIPEVYALMTDGADGRRGGDGNVMIRNLGASKFHFLWTSGRATTESFPMDVLSFDEVQEMTIADMEKTRERLSASSIRYILMGSTAKWPDRDIHYWYKKGTQHQFHTWCAECGAEHVLDEVFPKCIAFDAETGNYRYKCVSCGAWIDDPQRHNPAREHGWLPKNPDAAKEKTFSVHFPQFLSPTISAREIIEAYYNADDMMNFYNRKLGKPYTDPSQVPINMEMLNECAQLGMSMGVTWKNRAKGTFMGIDQMGAFNVVLIAERLDSGHLAIIHAEEIYNDNPFARCDELMAQYGVAVCVVETLPNYNDAKRFAGRHMGKVFLAGYGSMSEEMLRWGDAVPNKQERKTAEEDRDRYTVTLDQYKCMQVALARIQSKHCVFPDPQGLVQEVVEKGERKTVAVLKDRVFFHFTRTALVVEMDDEERKFRRKVVKVGIDPHFSYAFMLLNVAWARAHGVTSFILPTSKAEDEEEMRAVMVERELAGVPVGVLHAITSPPQGTCGRCLFFDSDISQCTERELLTQARAPGCEWFADMDD